MEEVARKVEFYTRINYLDYDAFVWLFIAQHGKDGKDGKEGEEGKEEKIDWSIGESLQGEVFALRNKRSWDRRLLRVSWYFSVTLEGRCRDVNEIKAHAEEYRNFTIYKLEQRLGVSQAKRILLSQVATAENEYREKIAILSIFLPVENLPEKILAMEKETRLPRKQVCKWAGKNKCRNICTRPREYCDVHEP